MVTNSVYAKFYGPDRQLHQGCPMCVYELEDLGPLFGPAPLHVRTQHFTTMPYQEWAGIEV